MVDLAQTLLLALAAFAALSLAVSACARTVLLRTLARRGPQPRRGVRPAEPPDAERLPPVSVLKPLKGADPGLLDNLAAFARQDYPCFELILGAADPDDPALEVARQFAAEHPEVEVRIVAGAPELGLNPKVRVLAELARHARFEHLLVSDADVRPDGAYLREAVREVVAPASPRPSGLVQRRPRGHARPRPEAPPVGLVASLLTPDLGRAGARPLGALLDGLHLATFVTPAVALAAAAGHPCVVGKSMLFRRSHLARLGGWPAVADVLAEDYLLGRKLAEGGYRVAVSAHPLTVGAGRRTVREFLARHLRWSQMRCRIAPAAYLAEPLLAPAPALVALGAAGAAAAAGGLAAGGWAAAGAAAALAAHLAVEAAVLGRLTGRRPRAAEIALLPLKDLLIAAVWLAAPFRRTVAWRGTRLRIGAGSRLYPLGAGSRPTPAPATSAPFARRPELPAILRPTAARPAALPHPLTALAGSRTAAGGAMRAVGLSAAAGLDRPRLPPAVAARLAEEAA